MQAASPSVGGADDAGCITRRRMRLVARRSSACFGELAGLPVGGLVADPFDEQFKMGNGVVVPQGGFEFGGVEFGRGHGVVPGAGVACLIPRTVCSGVPVAQQRSDSGGLAARGDPGQVLLDQHLEQLGVGRLVGDEGGARFSPARLGGDRGRGVDSLLLGQCRGLGVLIAVAGVVRPLPRLPCIPAGVSGSTVARRRGPVAIRSDSGAVGSFGVGA